MEHRESAFALDKTLRSAKSVVRRHFASEFLRLLGIWLCFGSLAAVALVAVGKWSFPGLLAWKSFALIGGAAVLAAAIATFRNAWTRERAARELDRRLGLHDLLGSALELRDRTATTEDPFIRELSARAEAAAASANAGAAVGFSLGTAWVIWPVGILLAVAVLWFVPERSQFAAAQSRKQAEEARETAAELRSLAKAVATQDRVPVRSERVSAPEADEAITALERELSEGKISSHEARVRAAEELSRKSAELEKQSADQQRTVEDARRALAKAAARSAGENSLQPEGDRIAEALRRGDIDAVADEIEKLARNEKNLTPDERDSAARQMEKISGALDSQELQDSQRAPERGSPAESLRDAARDAAKELRDSEESANAPRSEPNPPPPSEDKPAEGRSPRAAPNVDSKPGSQSEEKPANPDGQRRPPQQDSAPRTNPAESNSEKQQQDRKDKSETQPEKDPGDRGTSPDSPKGSEKNAEKSGDSSGKNKEQGKPPESEQRTPAQPESRKNSEGQQNTQSERSPSNEREKESKPVDGLKEKTESQGEPRPQSKPGDSKPQSGPKPPGEEQSAQQENGQPNRDQSAPTGSQQKEVSGEPEKDPPQRQEKSGKSARPEGEEKRGEGGSVGQSLEQVAKELRGLAKQGEDAKRRQETARGLRDRAEQMMESASPEDRARMEQLAKQLARSERNPAREAYPEWHGPTQAFDTRAGETSAPSPEAPPDRTIAEWLSEPKPGGKGPGGVLPAEPLRKATEGAQQAIEQQAIPPRYTDLVKRVFKRYSEKQSRPSGAPK